MRALGSPRGSTVASVMASGRLGSARPASSNHVANRRKGSGASAKSPLINPFGCCIGADSDILEYRPVLGSWLWPSGYRGTRSARLRRTVVRAPLLALSLAALSLAVGGCSFSYQLDSLTGKGEPEHASSLRPTRSLSSMPPEQDLAVARAAVSEFLGRGGTDSSSMPSEDPRTGARRTITTTP